MSKQKSFVRQHILGWICAVATLIGGFISQGIYAAYRAPVEAQIAAGQASDSNTAWAVHQAAQNDLFPMLIGIATFVIVVLFLIPTITHVIRLLKNGDI